MSRCRNAVQPLLRLSARARTVPAVILPRAASSAVAPSVVAAAQRAIRPRAESSRGGPRRNAAPQSPGLAELLDTFTGLKEEGRKPTAAAYIALLTSAADYGMRRGNTTRDDAQQYTLAMEIALAAVRDAQAGGIELGADGLDQLLRFTYLHPDILPSLLVEMTNTRMSTPSAYNTLASHAIGLQHLEELILIMVEMFEQNVPPTRVVLKNVVRLCAQWGLPRLAQQVVHRLHGIRGAPKVDADIWVYILTSSADCQYHAGVVEAWERVVPSKAYTPDEGLILAVLAVAARWGDVNLATSALAVLPDISVTAKEHHLAPLLEAYCREGRVPEALKVISSIRGAGIEPKLSTVAPVVSVLTTTEVIDQAFYTLEDMHKKGEPVDIQAVNALIQASTKLGDLARARATQLATKDLGLAPTLDTFNLVLDACIAARHTSLAETVLSELGDAGLRPDARTYEALIRLALTQPKYEDAFYYLEKMKADSFRPSSALYHALGHKCAANNDKRWRLVAEEMGTLGYKVTDFAQEREARQQRPRREGRDGERRSRDGREGREGRGNRGNGERRTRDRPTGDRPKKE